MHNGAARQRPRPAVDNRTNSRDHVIIIMMLVIGVAGQVLASSSVKTLPLQVKSSREGTLLCLSLAVQDKRGAKVESTPCV